MSNKPVYILGVDLGQAQDYTALSVLERTKVDIGRTEGHEEGSGWKGEKRMVHTPVTENHFAARHLERLAIGTPYPAQVARIKELWEHLKAETGTVPRLVVDQTGVGRPVVDMLRVAQLEPVAITITGGDAVTHEGRDYRVPKRDLVSVVGVLLQSERLKIAKALKEAPILTAELLAFKVSVSLKGHDSYGNNVGPWRENPHDDMVLAVAIASWFGEVPEPVRRRSRSAYQS